MNLRYKLMRFLSGRYGPDTLFYILVLLAAVLSVINLFIRNIVLQLLVYALMIIAILRFFSRNTYARSRENRWVSEKINAIKQKRDTYKDRRADRFHIYKKCPRCKAVLRLPRRIGKHKTICPRCSREFTVRVKK